MKNSYQCYLILFFLFFSHVLFAQWERTKGPVGDSPYDLAANEQFIFACTNSGLYRSADTNEPWELKNNGLPFYFTCYAVKTHNENVLLGGYIPGAGTPNIQLFKSTNNGDDWSEIPMPPSFNDFGEIGIYDNIIFIAGESIFKTEDDGQNWTTHLPTIDFQEANNMEIYDEKLYILENNTFSISEDWGESWEVINLPNNLIGETIYADGNLLIVTAIDQAVRSTDGGGTWEEANNWTGIETRIRALNGVLYTHSDKLVHSVDNGLNWEIASTLLNATFKRNLTIFDDAVFATKNSNSFHSVLDNKGVQKYDPVSELYSSTYTGFDNAFTRCLTIHENKLFASTIYGNIYTYDLATETWLPNILSTGFSALTDLDWLGNNFYALIGSPFGKLFRSTDEGQNWTELTSGPGLPGLESMLVHEQRLYFFRSGKLAYQSDDFGETLDPALPDFEAQLQQDIKAFTPHGNYLFAGNNTVYRSEDNGITWEEKSNGLLLEQEGVWKLFSAADALILEGHDFDPVTQTHSWSIFISFDNGDNWAQAENGLPDLGSIANLGNLDASLGIISDAVSFSDSLVISAYNGGIYLMVGNDMNWQPFMNDGVYPKKVFDLELSFNKVFTTTEARGVMQTDAFGLLSEFATPVAFTAFLDIYPNPVKNEFSFFAAAEVGEKCELRIYNIMGQLFLSKKVKLGALINVSVQEFPAGQYFVKAEGADINYVGKFMKQ